MDQPAQSMRPLLHFAPDWGWMNDPNGPIRRADGWHLFYQKSTDAPDHRAIGWGHAISDDLLVWHDLGMSIPPGEDGWAYSGCTVADPGDSGQMLAFFTRHKPDETSQTQDRARSSDGGLTWEADPEGPLIDEGLARFRDPFLLRLDDGSWRMLTVKPIAWHDWQRGASRIAVHASSDLREWAPVGDLGITGGPGEIFEVPVLLRLPVEAGPAGSSRWLLVVSVVDRAGGAVACRTIAWIGDFDGAIFSADTPSFPLDHGPDYYAATAFAGLPPDDALMIAWLGSWAYARCTPPLAPLGGTLTLPRRLALVRRADGRLHVRQVPGVDPARYATSTARVQLDLSPGVVEALPFRATSFVARLAIEFGTAAHVTLSLREGDAATTLIMLDRAAATITLDRSRSGAVDFHASFAGSWAAPLPLEGDRAVLTIVVDRGSVELFAGDGEETMTAQIFPPAGHDRASILADGTARVTGEVALLDGAAHRALHPA